ncbi:MULTISPECIES: Zn-ribbon-containing protein [Pasteurellaceae]|uniref:Zn-ribbon-containing protein n=1 Tax=Pasteurella atlantica TaxID=2827233 RepID=A0AAW8CQK1_9PAST|nr:Zn-ribbon-containing protein [Pasteurella atlantica]MBR0573722.1 Zn-ribbon-containing protein [Pasteurella atlantica]MDP8039643.1 Zn-ribbon-containing protein [Pasteurella atlantica]MDP8041734.1 Zn-ribbon-containing protein [Pasteurella atlantica]MDP8043992.1 Zn-ribbon-containing protein [Pasteurella atlantica]MDP8045970.1 Zn-ribbon-containing protein [Pasteurella atlantica]
MYQAIAKFSYPYFDENFTSLIFKIVNQWRENGQMIGREAGITHFQCIDEAFFQVNLSIPRQDSLMAKYNSDEVNKALSQADSYGVKFASFELVGKDYRADVTSHQIEGEFLLLYTTHLDSCSPVFNGADFLPLPLYEITQSNQPFSADILKWQEDWQACDQLQMNGSTLEQSALQQISDHTSELAQQGRTLCQRIEQITQTPTYYYLYRLGKDEEIEHNRKCPNCNEEWKLNEPMHSIFYFKCDKCRLISNLSWEVL